MRQVGLRAGFVQPGTDLCAQVLQRLLRVFRDPRLASQRVVWHPHPASRPRSRAPDLRRFLDQKHVEAQMRSSHRRGQAAGARPRNQQVAFEIRTVAIRHIAGL